MVKGYPLQLQKKFQKLLKLNSGQVVSQDVRGTTDENLYRL